MAESSTITIRLPAATKKKLGQLAAHTNRTKSFLAGEAIEDYVERELAIIEGIKRDLPMRRQGHSSGRSFRAA